MTQLFNRKLLRWSILLLVLAELLSLTSFIFTWLNVVVFFVVLALVLIISLKKLEWGLYIVLAEIFIGSFGRLFSLEFDGNLVSLRMGLWLIVMAVWLGQSLNRKGSQSLSHQIKTFFTTKLGKWYTVLGLVLLWGLIWGLARNEFANVFFDFNNWLYFLLILPFYEVFLKDVTPEGTRHNVGRPIVSRDSIVPTEPGLQNDKTKNILTILAASMLVLSVKTILLEWFFAHQVTGTIEFLYTWVRDFGIGEVTYFTSNFYRVFIQGQVWLLIGFFTFLGFLPSLPRSGRREVLGDSIVPTEPGLQSDNRVIWLALIFSSTSLIISFSRSLWLGLVIGLAFFFTLLLFKFKWPIKRVLKWGVSFLGVLVLELALIFAIINIPPVKDGGSFGSLVSSRLTQVEAAGSSRINLLAPLTREIIKHPVIGSGFGTTVTYKSTDPRIVASTAGGSGAVTTFAFEWGYLDILLKIGLLGLVVYLGLLWQLLKNSWLGIKYSWLNFGLLIALIALIFTNITTPYLNHPLGIGFIVLLTVVISGQQKTSSEEE